VSVFAPPGKISLGGPATSHVEASVIEQQEEELRSTCVAYANEAFA